MNSFIDLSIIIVNFKTPLLTNDCISSIKSSEITFKYEVIVIDNHSNDNSKELILNTHPDVNFISNSYNAGFGRANNLGVEKSNGSYILLLNSDLTVEKNSISTCYNYIVSSVETGIVSCEILYPNGEKQNFTSTIASYKKILSRNLFVDFLNKDGFKYKEEAVMGSFMMFKKEVFNEIGGFDPDFFMYSEEIELCHRFKLNNYGITILDSVQVYHLNGGSSSDRDWAAKQSFLSSALLFYKVKGNFGYLFYHFLILFNTITNFILMWRLDSNYRSDYFKYQKNYFYGAWMYLKIPLLYNRKIGSGNRLLRLYR
ncbi:glycosyltransferase family 2 protein [Brumimicrobium sp.]|uniref:glycosyltransferase family 2 protein n=1 Tax=Brumimicrobium sp. TaxID=2029867 RepID=UPI003A8FCF8A